MVLFSFRDDLSLLKEGLKRKIIPERSEGVLLSIARRVNGICNPSTPTLMKAQSQDGAFIVLGRFEFNQIKQNEHCENKPRLFSKLENIY
jgi:hypothetical protein